MDYNRIRSNLGLATALTAGALTAAPVQTDELKRRALDTPPAIASGNKLGRRLGRKKMLGRNGSF